MTTNNLIRQRLMEFLNLESGWLNGVEGTTYDPEPLEWLAKEFETHYPGDLPTPYLYPIPEGGVSAEWHTSVFMLVVEVNLNSQQAEASAIFRSPSGRQAEEWSFDLSTVTGWGDWVKQLRNLVSQTATTSF